MMEELEKILNQLPEEEKTRFEEEILNVANNAQNAFQRELKSPPFSFRNEQSSIKSALTIFPIKTATFTNFSIHHSSPRKALSRIACSKHLSSTSVEACAFSTLDELIRVLQVCHCFRGKAQDSSILKASKATDGLI